MDEGGVTDYGHSATRLIPSPGQLHALGHANGGAHAQAGVNGRQRRGGAQRITAYICLLYTSRCV